ncbi:MULTISPECIES: hypothetical protein [unclassified Streptomyces]|uniref:hypothetical protein n=1 Tax=unclassified Streptomyces TaxID=2593676 RepID=UPI0033299505
MSEDVGDIPDAIPARPWRPEDGPWPVVWTWPSDPPVLWVRHGGRDWPGTVMAKQVWADGCVRYQLSVNLGGDTRTLIRLFQWPQPGLAVAHRSAQEPVTGTRAQRERAGRPDDRLRADNARRTAETHRA